MRIFPITAPAFFMRDKPDLEHRETSLHEEDEDCGDEHERAVDRDVLSGTTS